LSIYESESPDDTLELGRNLATRITAPHLVGLIGPLGSGKTVFVKGLAEGLGVTEPVVSPSYTLIQEYDGFAHMDLYRLAGESELEDLDPDYYFRRLIVAVEWADRFPDYLPDDRTTVLFTMKPNDKRTIEIRRAAP
jgi:tRNA threonylcarbamoyladenosine biosynthesis protein TsaE